MLTKYSREVTVLPSICDASARLGIEHAFDVFMDTATEHAELTGVGVYDMAGKGLGWITVKTRIHFYERPKMMDRLVVSTWAQTLDDLRCERGYSAEMDGRLAIASKTEWAVVEAETGKLHSIKNGVYPSDIIELCDDRVLEEPFFRIRTDFENAELLGRYKVVSNDVDLYGHMNNAKYAFALTSMFASKELMKMNITDIQLIFKSPCYEGEELEFVKVADGNVMEVAAVTQNKKTVLLARLEGDF